MAGAGCCDFLCMQYFPLNIYQYNKVRPVRECPRPEVEGAGAGVYAEGGCLANCLVQNNRGGTDIESTGTLLIVDSDEDAMKSQWESTRGILTEPAVNNKGNDVGKLLLCLYDSGYGWYMAPETNWKTQYGPEVKDDQSSPSYTYMLRPFAVSTAWANAGSDGAKVLTCPESFQLMLRPGEAFEFIAVNITTTSWTARWPSRSTSDAASATTTPPPL